jgi:hypothetical protein
MMQFDKINITVEITSVFKWLSFDVLVKEINDSKNGKDLMIDWDFDNFNTGGNLWYDANGLQMVHKELWKRSDYNYTPTKNIASNFFPI